MARYRWYSVHWQTEDVDLAAVLGKLEHKQPDLEAAKQRAEDLRLLFGVRVKVLSECAIGNYEIQQRPFVGERKGRGFKWTTDDEALASVLEKYEIGVKGKSGWRKRQALERVFGKAVETSTGEIDGERAVAE